MADRGRQSGSTARTFGRRLVAVLLLTLATGCDDDPTAIPQAPAPPSSAPATTTAAATAAATQSASPSTVAMPTAKLARPDAWDAEPAPNAPTAAELPIYRITQTLDDVAGTFSGTAVLTYRNAAEQPLTALPLLLHPNASRELGVAAAQSGSLTVEAITRLDAAGRTVPFQAERPTLVVARLEPPVQSGQAVTLSVRYRGTLRKLAPGANDLFSQALGSMGSLTAGAGASDYGLVAVGDGILTAASAYPMVAPYRDGAFDTSPPLRFGDLAYNHVARFELRTVVPREVTVVTNLVDSAPVPLDAERQVVASAGSFVRDLVVVAGRDLRRSSRQHGPTRVTSVYRAADRRGGEIALRLAVASLRSFEQRFGPYPFTELDVVEASLVGGAGGVEFPGMVLIAGMLYRRPDESNHPVALMLKLMGRLGPESPGAETEGGGLADLLGYGKPRDPAPPPTGVPTGSPFSAPGPGSAGGVSSAAVDPNQLMADLLRGALEFTVAHEVAHQYFAGIVGNDSHRFPSLDEPIAQYAAGLVIEDLYGKAAGEAAMNANVKLNYAMYRLLGGPDRSVLRDVDSFRTPVEYAGLVYGKAPYAYVALREKLGSERLHEAVRHVVASRRFQLVSTDDWISSIEAEAGGPTSGVRPIFDRYLRQNHGDSDLAVDDSGDFVLDAMYGPALGAQVRQSFALWGMRPRDVFRMSLGGVADVAPPPAPGR